MRIESPTAVLHIHGDNVALLRKLTQRLYDGNGKDGGCLFPATPEHVYRSFLGWLEKKGVSLETRVEKAGLEFNAHFKHVRLDFPHALPDYNSSCLVSKIEALETLDGQEIARRGSNRICLCLRGRSFSTKYFIGPDKIDRVVTHNGSTTNRRTIDSNSCFPRHLLAFSALMYDLLEGNHGQKP